MPHLSIVILNLLAIYHNTSVGALPATHCTTRAGIGLDHHGIAMTIAVYLCR